MFFVYTLISTTTCCSFVNFVRAYCCLAPVLGFLFLCKNLTSIITFTFLQNDTFTKSCPSSSCTIAIAFLGDLAKFHTITLYIQSSCNADMSEALLNKKKEVYGSTEAEVSDDEVDGNKLELDEVYEKIGRGRAQYIYWILTGLLSISDQAEITIISVILPSLRCQWNLSPMFESATTLSVFVSYAIFGVAFGKISDIIGRKVVLLWSINVLIIAARASAFAPDKWVFLIARSVTGACIGINLNCILCYATEFSESKDRLIGLMVFNSISSVGPPLVYFLSWLMLNHAGWRALILAVSSPLIPALALVIFLPGSPRYYLVSGQKEKAMQATRWMAKLNNKHLPSNFKLASLRNEDIGSFSVIFGAEHRRSLITLSAQFLCNVFIGFAFILYQPLIYTSGCTSEPTNQSTRTCSFSNRELAKLTLSTIPMLLGNTTASISAYVLRRLLALRMSGFLLIFVTAALFFCVNDTVVFLVASAINFLGCFSNASRWILFPETFPTNIRTTAIGFINGCGKIGGLLGSGSVSVFYYMNSNIVAGLILIASIVGFAMSLIYNKETRDVTMKDT